MDDLQIYEILRNIVQVLSKEDDSFRVLPDVYVPETMLVDLGLDLISLPEVIQDFESRFNGKDLGLETLLSEETLNSLSLGEFIEKIRLGFSPDSKNRIVVYVDDEEENIFIFKRKYGKRLNLKAFTDPVIALEYIQSDENVCLVITDEVMPKLSGNDLCDEVHKTRPSMKFILITGNPNNDDDLLHRTLRKNRFYEFINKPVDFENKGEEYFAMIQGLVDFDW